MTWGWSRKPQTMMLGRSRSVSCSLSSMPEMLAKMTLCRSAAALPDASDVHPVA